MFWNVTRNFVAEQGRHVALMGDRCPLAQTETEV